MLYPESWRVGAHLNELETPFWLVDEVVMRANLARMAKLAGSHGVRLRPHIKTHKTPAFAKLQLESGARGVATATFTEAELMADAGIDDIFVVYQPSDAHMRRRLIRLASKGVRTGCTVDDLDAARALAADAIEQGTEVDVYLEVNISDETGITGRCGVSIADAPAMALELQRLEGLRFRGILGYRGIAWLYSFEARDYTVEDLEATALEEARMLTDLAEEIRKRGVPVDEVVAGSTPTTPLLMDAPGITEVQPGEYIFYGGTHVGCGVCRIGDCALSIRATVVSASGSGRAIINAGSKVFAGDINPGLLPNLRLNGYGIVRRPEDLSVLEDVALQALSEEHGTLRYDPSMRELKVGDVVDVIPAHVCTCVNLANALVVASEGRVSAVSPVGARGFVW